MNIRQLKIKIRVFLWKVLGSKDTQPEVKRLQEQVKTLQFLLNTLHDVKKVPPTSDCDLRLLQLCDSQLLVLIDKLCEKHHLNYWLDYGTLLGAYRHKGFIPWDDDTDIAMLRSDYNQIANIINQELGQYGIHANEIDGRIGVGYRHKETGIWIDLYPIDDYFSENTFEIDCQLLSTICKEYKSHIINKNKPFISKDLAQIIIDKLYSEDKPQNHHFAYYCPRSYGAKPTFNNYDDIFPLKKISFEGYNFKVPNKIELYLERLYTKGFKSFPTTGILNHGIGRTPLSTWAKENNVDMNKVLTILKNIEI